MFNSARTIKARSRIPRPRGGTPGQPRAARPPAPPERGERVAQEQQVDREHESYDAASIRQIRGCIPFSGGCLPGSRAASWPRSETRTEKHPELAIADDASAWRNLQGILKQDRGPLSRRRWGPSPIPLPAHDGEDLFGKRVEAAVTVEHSAKFQGGGAPASRAQGADPCRGLVLPRSYEPGRRSARNGGSTP